MTFAGGNSGGRIGVVSLAVAAAVALSLGVATPASADPDVPSWSDIEAARANESTTQAQIDDILELITELEATANEYGRVALERGEDYQIANDALTSATTKSQTLKGQADAAAELSVKSGQQAGQLMATLARTSGGSVTLGLLMAGDDTDEMLNSLGTISQLTERTREVYERAESEKNTAQSLTAQASAAEKVRAERAATATSAFTQAESAAITATARVAEQTAASDQLYEQLASLKGTTSAMERDYVAEVARAAAEAALGLTDDTATDAGEGSPGEATGGSDESPNEGNGTPTTAPVISEPSATPSSPAVAPTTPAAEPGTPPAPAAPAPVVTPPVAEPEPEPAPAAPAPAAPVAPAPAPAAPSAGAPNASAVAGAIAYAKSQLGDSYQLNGAGPDLWDCSGLTKMSYSSVGTYIGTHSSTNQYSTMKAAGHLVSLGSMVAGDLLFYANGGAESGDKYHVAMYIGGGQMIEAPYAGQVVRIVAVRYGDLVKYAGRPTA